MKKYHLYLWIVALVGLMTACSQDEAAGPQTYEPTSVTLSASVNRSIQTRAITMPNNCKLRYILEVWTTGESPVLKLRKEELKEDFSGVDFTFDLTDAADYNALLWADFIQASVTTPTTQTISGVECDHYQDLNFKTTDNLKNIIRTPAGNIPTLHNDAFCACHPISKKTGAYSGNVQLVRPFGQINIIEKDVNALAKVDQTKAVFNVPKGYNVENGMPTSETEPATKTATFYPLSGSNNDCTANLFYDYIFAPTTGQTTLGEIKLTFISSDPTFQIGDFTIPANMPVERNKRTNISGHIVSVSDAPSDEAKLSVTISDGWSNDLIEKDSDPKVGDYYYKNNTWSTENKATNANPIIGVVYEVNADGTGKVVSLTEKTNLKWGKTDVETEARLMTGKENTDKVFALINNNPSYNLSDWPIFNACQELRTSTGNNGWCVPYYQEYVALFKVKSTINDKIRAVSGGTELVEPTGESDGYWTSKEDNNSYAAFIMKSGTGSTNINKGNGRKVRFVLDF